MPFNGSGTFQLNFSWPNDAANGIPITASRMQSQEDDIASGLSDCVTRDGQSPATANLPMGGFKLTNLANGSTAGDSLAYGQGPTLITTLTASNSASLSFVGFSSAYSTYEFVFNGILAATDATLFEAQLSLDAGANWLSGSHYFYGSSYWNDSSSSAGGPFANAGANSIWLLNLAAGAGLSNASPFSGKMRLQNMNSSTVFQSFSIDFVYFRTGVDFVYGGCGQGLYNSAGVKNGIKFFMAAGNITSGSIEVWGIP